MSGCDPLQVCPLDERHVQQLLQKYVPGQLYEFEFAEDRYFKDYCAGSSTPYTFVFPDANADALLEGLAITLGRGQPMTFVQYLRMSLKWAGFPGMAEWSNVSQEDLDFLTKDLIPF